jgi:hypothetical protein
LIFFFSDNIFYSYINTDINISWTTRLGQFYHVLSPSNRTIYIVIGDIVPNTDMNKYKINSKDIEQIDISVLNVNQNDSGIYQSVSLSESSNVDGCCLLIITGLHILLYFCMFKKYMWRNRFFNFSNYLDEGSARMLEAILRTCDGSI